MKPPTPRREQVRQYLWRFAEVACLVVFVGIICLLFVVTLKYTLPFVIGGFVSILLFPIVRWVEHRGLRRAPAVIVVLVSTGLAVFLLSSFVLVAVTREAVKWSQSIPMYFRLIQDWVVEKVGQSQSIFGNLPPDVASSVQSSILHSITTTKDVLTSLTGAIVSAVTHMPESLFVVVIAVLTTYFILANRNRMYRTFLRILPPGWEPKVHIVAQDMFRALGGTIRVQVVLMLMSAVLGMAGLAIMGIHYAVILGLLFGVTGIIPILGSAILTVPWAAGALLIGDVNLALKVIILQLAISLIRHMIEPKILADSVGLDTLSTLFGLYVGMKLMGVVGLMFGPIILIGVKSLLRIRLFVDFMPRSAQIARSPAAADDVSATDADPILTNADRSSTKADGSSTNVNGSGETGAGHADHQ